MSDAWRYADNPIAPDVVNKLLQAVLTAHATIVFAQTQVNPEQFGTVPDWKTVRLQLHEALHAAGHPAGDISL